jgi:phosphoribosyl 1,2-cyclic phosphate phosphodiesterase
VNDDLLIDFGPDLLASAQRFNRSLWGVTTGLVTHAHSDHFYPSNFYMRKADFTAHLDVPTLRVYGPREVAAGLAQLCPNLSDLRVEVNLVHAFERWQNNGYSFASYQAYHAVGNLETLFYSVDDGQRAFLYATDTGPFPEATWQALEGQSFDVIILEETLGNGQYNQHMSYQSFREHIRRMRAAGMLRPGGRVIAHHFSHSSNPPYDKLAAILRPEDVEVAYDGLEVVF